MGYTSSQISDILLKTDRTMYKIGSIAYENMFSENDESLDYKRDIIYIYQKAVDWADAYYVGTTKLDKVVERLAAYISIYDYGTLNPVYSASVGSSTILKTGAYLDDLLDVTISNVQDKQYLRYDAASGQWINFGINYSVRSSEYFTATAGQTTFVTTAPFDPNLLDVYVNGVKVNASSYTLYGQHSIILNDACLLGDIIDVIIHDPVGSAVNTPNQVGNAGKFLTTDGYTLSWADVVQDRNYVHDQQTASASWVVVHNLGKFASVGIVDTAGDEILGEVRHNSVNQVTITFSVPVSGKAYIN